MILHGQKEHDSQVAITLGNLKQHIRTLITLGATDAPVVSCYLDLEPKMPDAGGSGGRQIYAKRAALLRKSASESITATC